MTPLWAVFTFLNLWWVCIFIFLSVGNTYGPNRTELDYAAAPDKPNLKKKFFYAALLSAALTAVIAGLMNAGIIRLA